MKKEVYKVKKKHYYTLPTQLVEDIKSLNLSKINTRYCYKFVGIIIRNLARDKKTMFEDCEISSNYIKKSFNGIKYVNWLKPLILNKIIICDNEKNHKIKSKCYYYTINNKYKIDVNKIINEDINNSTLIDYFINNPLETKELQKDLSNIKKGNFKPSLVSKISDSVDIQSLYNKVLTVVEVEDNLELNKQDLIFLNWFREDIEKLKIDYDILLEILVNKVNDLKIEAFAVNEQILDEYILLVNSMGNKYYCKKENAIKKALEMGKFLIKDNKRFVFDSPDNFINEKKNTIIFSYLTAIENLKRNCLRASRNVTNNRIDTNFTNLCSDFVDDICEKNNLVQIDLHNSQFVMLSKWLKEEKINTEDCELFKKLSANGGLYNYIAEKLSLGSRKEGKLACFEILFSSRKNTTPNKKKLKEIFPSVIEFIDSYKKEHGDNKFSIELQKIEASIFIDNIYTKIKKCKKFCITKHDSIIIKENDYEEIKEIIKTEFEKIGLDYSLDYKF